MRLSDENIKYELRIIRIIHAALGAGVLAFAGIAVLLERQGEFQAKNDLHPVLIILASILAIIGMMGSRYIFTRMIVNMREYPGLKKLKIYRNAHIVRFSLLEAPILFSLAGYLLTSSLSYVLIALVLFVLYLLARPSEFKMRIDLGQESI